MLLILIKYSGPYDTHQGVNSEDEWQAYSQHIFNELILQLVKFPSGFLKERPTDRLDLLIIIENNAVYLGFRRYLKN